MTLRLVSGTEYHLALFTKSIIVSNFCFLFPLGTELPVPLFVPGLLPRGVTVLPRPHSFLRKVVATVSAVPLFLPTLETFRGP